MYKLTQSELRASSREKLESLEHWLRRLIDETFTTKYGDYFSYVDNSGKRLINKKIVDGLDMRMAGEPDRYPRKIDAILIGEAIQIVCNPNHFSSFKDAFLLAFPEGCDEARTFLTRLVEPRNKLSHANAISIREAERIICYSNDVIDSIKKYYIREGMNQEYNVPLILKLTDSFGNVFHRTKFVDKGTFKSVSLKKKTECFLRPGDTLSIELEIDPSFAEDSYDISWSSTQVLSDIVTNQKRISMTIDVGHVGENFNLQCRIKSGKDWHRLGDVDDTLLVSYKVLPPP